MNADDSPERISDADAARTLLVANTAAMLSTIVADRAAPYGSLVDYCGSDAGEAVLLLSDLAVHTTNVRACPRASLLVTTQLGRPPAPDQPLLASQRATFIGQLTPVDEPTEALRQAYIDAHPAAQRYVAFSDFGFWRFRVDRVRYIGGFGRMSWIDGQRYEAGRPDPLAQHAAGAIEHMNQDHPDALAAYARAFGGADRPASVGMVGLDRLGFDLHVHADDRRSSSLRVGFDDPVDDPADIRPAMVDMVRRARQKLDDSPKP